jgi:hypothetical protein
MTNLKKNAWLIGRYSTDIATRIEKLGYKLTWLFPRLEQHNLPEGKPSLIVFSDEVNNVESIELAKNFFPKAVLISFPTGAEKALEGFGDFLQLNTAMSRLLTSIKEREYRWDN